MIFENSLYFLKILSEYRGPPGYADDAFIAEGNRNATLIPGSSYRITRVSTNSQIHSVFVIVRV